MREFGVARAIHYLNFSNEDLFGWEDEKSKLVVASLAEQILLGAKLPPVEVVQRSRYSFELASEHGGHNRALAYYHLGGQLPCIVLERLPIQVVHTVNIRDIKLVSDKDASEFDRMSHRVKIHPAYLQYSGKFPFISQRLSI